MDASAEADPTYEQARTPKARVRDGRAHRHGGGERSKLDGDGTDPSDAGRRHQPSLRPRRGHTDDRRADALDADAPRHQQPRKLLCGAPDPDPPHGPVARAGDPDHDDELHADHHRPLAAAAGARDRVAAAEPGADRAVDVHDVPRYGPDDEADQR